MLPHVNDFDNSTNTTENVSGMFLLKMLADNPSYTYMNTTTMGT